MLGDSLRRGRRTEAEAKAGERPERQAWGWPRWLGLALIVGVVTFGIGYLLATLVLFPMPELAGAGVAVPDLRGEPLSTAERRLREAGLLLGDTLWLPEPETEPGRVLAQEPLPGQRLRRGSAVRLALSQGRQQTRVPPVAGLGEREAATLLRELGFDVAQRALPGGLPEGSVLGTDPAAGTHLSVPTTVTVLVSSGPPASAPDTVGAAAAAAEEGRGGA